MPYSMDHFFWFCITFFFILYNIFLLSKGQKILSSYENQTILYCNYTSYILDAIIIHRMNWTCIKLIIVYGGKITFLYSLQIIA